MSREGYRFLISLSRIKYTSKPRQSQNGCRHFHIPIIILITRCTINLMVYINDPGFAMGHNATERRHVRKYGHCVLVLCARANRTGSGTSGHVVKASNPDDASLKISTRGSLILELAFRQRGREISTLRPYLTDPFPTGVAWFLLIRS